MVFTDEKERFILTVSAQNITLSKLGIGVQLSELNIGFKCILCACVNISQLHP